jgi:hypothetical protein
VQQKKFTEPNGTVVEPLKPRSNVALIVSVPHLTKVIEVGERDRGGLDTQIVGRAVRDRNEYGGSVQNYVLRRRLVQEIEKK